MYKLIFLLLLFSNSMTAQLHIRKILPADTDAAIDRFSGTGYEHYVYLDEGVKKRNELMVFLPGTGGKGGGGRNINEMAAAKGYHVISLIYPDSIAMAQVCRNSADSNCFETARAQLLKGGDKIASLSISSANAIENRLVKLLLYLDDKFPAENWKQFLKKDGTANWEKIAVAGLSQGGGHAAYIAMKYKVARVLMFAAPKDFNIVYNKPGTWEYINSQTPANRYFGFVHSKDDKNGCTFPQQLEVFKAMGLYTSGDLVNVDSVAAPYNYARLLTSTRAENNFHTCVVTDTSFESVWDYMLTAAIK